MAGSSPIRPVQDQQGAYPLYELLYGNRNSEARHREILEKSRRVAETVQENSQKVLQDWQLEQQKRDLAEQQRAEEERIRKERDVAAARDKLKALKAQKVDVPPAPQPTPEPVREAAKAAKAPTTRPIQATTPHAVPATSPSSSGAPVAIHAPPQQQSALSNGTNAQQSALPPTVAQPQTQTSSPFARAVTTHPPAPGLPAMSTASPFAAPAAQPVNPTPAAPPPTAPFAQVQRVPQAPQSNGVAVSKTTNAAARPANGQQRDRYEQIHKKLKELRRSLETLGEQNKDLRAQMGNMRREIRMRVGQLVHGAQGANRPQLMSIVRILKEALGSDTRGPMVNVADIILEQREEVVGAEQNRAELPSLFIYGLNVFAKAAISQFINEASARPETADPVGVTVVTVFSEPDFLWRGKSLIDILLAKFRVHCPVLFGYYGNEKYEEGRRRLGWHKEFGEWVPEQQHMDRMTGLGAGFASISLRNFGKSKKKNPYPPSNYWTAMARIVNTPAADISNTQAIVLKAMIENSEKKFLDAYGSAGLAALRIALVDFPNRPAVKTPALASLEVLAQLLRKRTGLVLT